MTVITFINLKGGVAKTISSTNFAYILNAVHGKRVLLIDNDKQGNTSKFFGLHSYDHKSLADLLTVRGLGIRDVIRNTEYSGLDVIPANMNLLRADKEILMDSSRPQQTRLVKALKDIEGDYDYVIIDNAPDLNMSVMNALVAADEVMIPIKVDKFAFDGLEILQEQIEDIKEFNPNIRIAGCFVTMFQKNDVNLQGEEYLKSNLGLNVFDTVVRRTEKRVDESTFAGTPLQIYSPRSGAARDYKALVAEYLESKALV